MGKKVNRKNKRILIVYLIMLFLFRGCGPKVQIPPVFDLTQFEGIGLVTFRSNVKGKLRDFVTGEFYKFVAESQKGSRIILIGQEKVTLESLNSDLMNTKAVKDIGKKYRVEALITGNIELFPVYQSHSLIRKVSAMGVKADVIVCLTVKLFETKNGSIIWVSTGKVRRLMENVSFFNGTMYFNAANPKSAYGDIVDFLLDKVTRDFKATYRRMYK